MAPPTSGPMAMARPAMPPQAPSATARRSGGHRRGQDGQRQRRDDRATDTLDGAGEDEDVASTATSAASAEPPMKIAHPDDEHALATEPVAERGAGDEQDRERQRVGVDHPLEVLPAMRRGRP